MADCDNKQTLETTADNSPVKKPTVFIDLLDTKSPGHSLLKKPENIPAIPEENELEIISTPEVQLLPELHVQKYKNEVVVDGDEKEEVEQPKNPPITKNPFNYWGKQK